MTPNLKSFYNTLYSKTPKIFGDSTRNWDEVVLQTLKPRAGVALDVGAGEGITSNVLANYGYQVEALDLSDNAFVSIENKNIHLFKTSIQDFRWEHDYDLIQIALVLHHLSDSEVQSVLHLAQEHTRSGGLHLIRVFTTKSEFAKQTQGDYFFDNGTNVNELYPGWEICLDDYVIAQAATADLTNEIRQVVFKKQ
jgi:2-polyprenyl-3-methyl-5-hydroxy-6-metoxy-1,4-benzoquinol methylase